MASSMWLVVAGLLASGCGGEPVPVEELGAGVALDLAIVVDTAHGATLATGGGSTLRDDVAAVLEEEAARWAEAGSTTWIQATLREDTHATAGATPRSHIEHPTPRPADPGSHDLRRGGGDDINTPRPTACAAWPRASRAEHPP